MAGLSPVRYMVQPVSAKDGSIKQETASKSKISEKLSTYSSNLQLYTIFARSKLTSCDYIETWFTLQ
jgi:hypothetical protein